MKTIHLATRSPQPAETAILIIYTGGTFGMIPKSPQEPALVPFDFEQIIERIPELNFFDCALTVIAFEPLLDSSNVNPTHWVRMAEIIEEHYPLYDGFVVLHGTDTMAYSAAALSFMLENLRKPVIFTGAQLPIGTIRNDARRNLVTAIEIASAKNKQGEPVVSEVGIYFNDLLLRGNRASKEESIYFDAFRSVNYPALAQVGVNILYNYAALMPLQSEAYSLQVFKNMDSHVGILKLFPGIQPAMLEAVLGTASLKGLVLETYGSGNAPTDGWFTEILAQAIRQGLVVFNVSQSSGGRVMQGKYATSSHLAQIGVVGGGDIHTEAALTKMMYLLAKYPTDLAQVKRALALPLRGEMSLLAEV